MSRPEPVKVGELLSLPENDYLYGTGAIRIRVTDLPPQQNLPDWIEITGVEISWDGARLGQRTVFIREAALNLARRNR